MGALRFCFGNEKRDPVTGRVVLVSLIFIISIGNGGLGHDSYNYIGCGIMGMDAIV